MYLFSYLSVHLSIHLSVCLFITYLTSFIYYLYTYYLPILNHLSYHLSNYISIFYLSFVCLSVKSIILYHQLSICTYLCQQMELHLVYLKLLVNFFPIVSKYRIPKGLLYYIISV